MNHSNSLFGKLMHDLSFALEEMKMVMRLCEDMETKAKEGKKFTRYILGFNCNPSTPSCGCALGAMIPTDLSEIEFVRRHGIVSWMTNRFGVSEVFVCDVMFAFDEPGPDDRSARVGEKVGRRLHDWVSVSNLWS